MQTKEAKAAKAIKAYIKKKGLTGKRAAKYLYGTLNNAGLMRSNKVTKRGSSPAHRRKR